MSQHEDVPWEKLTTLQSNPPEGRGLKTYEETLGFRISELKGNVLDLGSGRRELFRKEAEAANKNIKVVSLNPDYSDEDYRVLQKFAGNTSERSVAGLAEQLPFKDETFDYIFANFSVSVYSDPKQMDKFGHMWVNELNRVLKANGEAIIFPFVGFAREDVIKKYNDFLDTLNSLGLLYVLEFSNFTWRGLDTFRIVIKKLPSSSAEK